MPATRPRRIVRRAVMALAVVVLLGLSLKWMATREPPEIQRSRAIKVGMTDKETVSVMGLQLWGWSTSTPPETWLVFGEATHAKREFLTAWNLRRFTKGYPGLRDYPVRVRLDKNLRVDRIERGDEVEASPKQ